MTLNDMLTRPFMNFGVTKSQASNTCPFGVAQLRHDLIGHIKENWIQEQYVECSQGYKFYDLTSRSFFEIGNARFLKEVNFGKEENIRNVVFEEESIDYTSQILVPITVQKTTLVIKDNVQIIVPNIRSIGERRNTIPYDYIVFLQEHEGGVGLTEDDPINFC
ncbi:hypothetical protein CR513_32915, partial [Mucuna pruriens]